MDFTATTSDYYWVQEIYEGVSTNTVAVLKDFVSDYWPYILSVLGVLLVIGIFRKLVKGGLRA